MIRITWRQESPDYTFNLYRSLYIDRDFELIASGIVGAPYGYNTYDDSTVTAGTIYYYKLTAVKDSIEGPPSVVYGVKAI